MELCILGSGSAGNAIYAAAGNTRLLIDAGLSCKQIVDRLAQIGVAPESIGAVLVTHDHIDHYQGLPVFCKRFTPTLFANEGTASGVDRFFREKEKPEPDWAIFENGAAFTFGDFQITPFSVPHDASDPVGYLLETPTRRAVVATDLGTPTAELKRLAAACHAIILESNHDYQMLRQSDRPDHLISRISGPHGHLNNDDAAEFLCSVCHGALSHLFLTHLSRDCNTAALARNTMLLSLRKMLRHDIRLVVAGQDAPTPLISI